MKTKEKIDGLLFLHIYFMPVLIFLSFLIGSLLILDGSAIAGLLWFTVPVSFYSFVGNYAPFFEIGVGAYLDGRRRIQWLMPFLIFSFFYNVLICTKAFYDILIEKFVGRTKSDWEKTEHLGKANHYI